MRTCVNFGWTDAICAVASLQRRMSFVYEFLLILGAILDLSYYLESHLCVTTTAYVQNPACYFIRVDHDVHFERPREI